jgi:hypothetical protein
MNRILLIILINLTAFACMTKTTHYEYADGSANRYVILPESLEYIPVKPEESSTGMYSGGEPKKIEITEVQFQTLKSLLEKAIANHEVLITDRIKMSGQISVITNNSMSAFTNTSNEEYILNPGCAEIVSIEGALKALLI